MPAQSYTINTGDGYEGQLYGLQQTRADIQTGFAENDGGISFGKAVAVGTGERGVVLGASGADAAVVHIAGISVRQIDREAATRPSDGTVVFRKGDTLPVMSDGRIVIKVADAGACVRGARVHVEKTTGKFFTAAGTGRVEAANVSWGVNKTAALGDLVHVVITNADLA